MKYTEFDLYELAEKRRLNPFNLIHSFSVARNSFIAKSKAKDDGSIRARFIIPSERDRMVIILSQRLGLPITHSVTTFALGLTDIVGKTLDGKYVSGGYISLIATTPFLAFESPAIGIEPADAGDSNALIARKAVSILLLDEMVSAL